MSALADVPQNMHALGLANQARLDAVAIKAEIRTGQILVSVALEDPRAGVVPIGLLLIQQPKWGPDRVSRILARHFIGEHRRVRDLTTRQVDLIRDALLERGL